MVDELQQKELDKIWAQKLNESEELGSFLKAIRKLEHLTQEKMGIRIADLEEGRETPHNASIIRKIENDDTYKKQDSTVESYRIILQEKIKEGTVSKDSEEKLQDLINKEPNRRSWAVIEKLNKEAAREARELRR